MDTNNRIVQRFIGGVAILLIIAGLFVNNINLAWIIIGLLFVDALYLSASRGWRWWKGNHNKIALRERFLLFLASLMFLFLTTGTALFMMAFVYEYDVLSNYLRVI